MLRRSSSSSNIPLPKKNLFGAKGKRSQSSSRLSQRDSGPLVGQVRPQRPTSLDRKSSTVGLLRTTPLLRAGARSGSLQRTTPTSAISQRTNSSRATTPSSNRKDYVTIQKLSTDKKWVSEQFVKVQNFVMQSDLFDLGVVNSTNIKPPSINNFIYITGVLFMEIFPRVKISKENYKEMIPAQLKVLKYPGTLTNSVLKTVNTIHSWPQVIGMWSWLIDKVNLCQNLDDHSFVEHLEPKEKTKVYLKQNVQDFFTTRYKIFNENQGNKEEIDKVNESYVANLSRYLDVDVEEFKRLEIDMVEKKQYRNKLEREVEHLNSETKKIASKIEEMNKEIEEFNAIDPIEESELDNEIQLLQSNIKDLTEAEDSTKENIASLQEAIKGQQCTYREKMALLQQIEELEKEIAVKRAKVEHAREIKNKFDHKLTAEIGKIQSLAIQWNRSLMEASIQKPYLKKLLLREKRFHDPDFLKELQEVSDTVEIEVVKYLAEIGSNLRIEEQKDLETERDIKELNGIVNRINTECAVVSDNIAETNKDMNKFINDMESQKAHLVQQMTDLQENDTVATQLKEICELKEKKEQMEVEVKKFGQKMLSFFVELHNQVVTNLTEMEGIKAKLIQNIEAKQINAVQKQREMIEVLRAFHKDNKEG